MENEGLAQEERVLNALLKSPGAWVNGQYFLRSLYLSQYHRAIWNLENKPNWRQKLALRGIRIEHSQFKDDFGFLSYRAVSIVPPGQLFHVNPVENPKDPARFTR